MKCPSCGYTMNHHAEKVLLEGFESDEIAARIVEAYSCPHCGTNANTVSQHDK
jgi:hypothetical protein